MTGTTTTPEMATQGMIWLRICHQDPDTEVITKCSIEEKDRSWLCGYFSAFFASPWWLTLRAVPCFGRAWAQVKPEMASVRDFLFQVAGVIIGFYYGSAVRRHRN